MRGVLSLVSLMVVAVIVAYLWATYTQKTASVTPQLHDQAEQLSGRSADGVPVAESIKTEEANDGNGHFKGLLVTDITPGGGMQKMYGLQRDDIIVNIGQLSTNELSSASMMQPFLVDAYQKSQPLIVIRHGQQITLPQDSPGSAPGVGGSIQNQINGIVKQSQQ